MRVFARKNWSLWLIVLVALGQFTLLSPGLGPNVDEGPYINAGYEYAGWLGRLLSRDISGSGQGSVMSTNARDGAWGINHEHPPVAKTVFGIFGRIFEKAFGLRIASRLGALAFLVMALVSLYFLIVDRFGQAAATLACLAVLSHPRLMAHATFASLDFPIVALSLLCALLFLRGLEDRRYALLCGVVFGLCAGVKINGVFLAAPLFAWGYLFHREKSTTNFFRMIFLGPLTFLLTWPWLWSNTFARIIEYLNFHVGHKHEPVFYLGSSWDVAPWHYPWAILIAATPLILTIFALPVIAVFFTRFRNDRLFLLAFLGAVPILVVTPTSVPAYNGLRLFLMTAVILCAFAGIAAGKIVEALVTAFLRKSLRIAVFCIVGGILLLPGFIGTVVTYPYELSYYSAAVGYRQGAHEKGFNPLPWAYISMDHARALREHLKSRPPVSVLPDSGIATILKDAGHHQLLGEPIDVTAESPYWLISANFAYSGFPRYWELIYDLDSDFKLDLELKQGGFIFQRLYRAE